MTIQFGTQFHNQIPSCVKYENKSVRDAVEQLVQPLISEYPDDTLTLTARTAPPSSQSRSLMQIALAMIRPVDNPLASDNTHPDNNIYQRIHSDIKKKQKLELETFPSDLEFVIKQGNQEKQVYKFVAPDIIPQETDYFFSQNFEAHDDRRRIQNDLRTLLTHSWLEAYYQHTNFLNRFFGTTPAENPEWCGFEHTPAQQ